MSKTQQLPALLFLLMACTQANAQIARYGATLHESQWGTSSSRMQCALRHKIPGYGQALFTKNAGEALIFSLSPSMPFPTTQRIELHSVAPAWKHGVQSKILLQIPTTEGERKIVLDGKQSLQLFNELVQGMTPIFKAIGAGERQTERLTAVSPVWLKPAQTEFTTCITNLLPYSYSQIRQSQLQFDFGSSTLLPEAMQRADQLVEFIQENNNIRRVRIDGHTDNVGRNRYNRTLGQRRAEAFKQYLLAKGVAEKMITLKSYGERKPQSSNRTPAGRAINRRILVTLER
ncbi:MAG: OmpA family protein [Candidatus Polarisedimenticolaceae bacterium]|nr:OmpA family protein [Candidatus Polarisedimenticolaceae bacterium]